jgi:type VI secretion system secreted protein Hcp
MFLLIQKSDGSYVQGETIDPQFTSPSPAIEILSWAWGESYPGTYGQNSNSGGGGTQGVSMNDMSFTMGVCKASTDLMTACAMGTVFTTATLSCRKAGGGPGGGQYVYLVVTLTNALVSSYQTGGSDGGSPIDSFTLNYQQIAVQYSVQNSADGSVNPYSPSFGWNLSQNAPVSQ